VRAATLALPLALALAAAACAAPVSPSLGSGGWSTSATTGQGGAGATTSTAAATTGGGGSARDYFEANVSPILDAACAECHSSAHDDAYAAPDFMGSSPAGYYDSLAADIDYVNASPATSQLVNKGLHTGPAFTPAEDEIVRAWLEMEAEKRFASGPDPGEGGAPPAPAGPTAEEALEAFGDCMLLDDWIETGMPEVATQGTLADGPCHKCHQSGVGANYMTSPADDASVSDGFENMRYGAPLLKLVSWTVNAETGQLEDVVPSDRWIDKGGEGTGHPKYVLANAHVDAIEAWFERAYARWASGECGGTP
jgi:hypothetical protein